MSKKAPAGKTPVDCLPHLKAINDTRYVLSGKWKVMIIGSLAFGKKRYMELQRVIEGIGSKMLSKELQALELNGLVRRTLVNSNPTSVEYELTEYGYSLGPVIDAMASWGKQHRARIMKGVGPA